MLVMYVRYGGMQSFMKSRLSIVQVALVQFYKLKAIPYSFE